MTLLASQPGFASNSISGYVTVTAWDALPIDGSGKPVSVAHASAALAPINKCCQRNEEKGERTDRIAMRRTPPPPTHCTHLRACPSVETTAGANFERYQFATFFEIGALVNCA